MNTHESTFYYKDKTKFPRYGIRQPMVVCIPWRLADLLEVTDGENQTLLYLTSTFKSSKYLTCT